MSGMHLWTGSAEMCIRDSNDASGFQHVYLCTGYTDLRKGIDGLISIVTGTFGLDPTEAGSIFLSVSYTHLDVYKRQETSCDEGSKYGKYMFNPRTAWDR